MKVNIVGKGVIPYINKVAPAMNIEVNEPILKKLVKDRRFKIFDSKGTGQITAATFEAPVVTEPVVEEKPVETPKPKKTSKKAKKEEYHPDVTVTEVPDEIGIDLAQNLDSVIETAVKVPTEEEPSVVEEKVDEPVAETEELEIPVEDVDLDEFPTEETAEDEVTEEATKEETPKQSSKKNKKKNRK